MSERITKRQVEIAFEKLCDLYGKKAHGKWNEVGAWQLEYASVYGGWVIQEVVNEQGGITHPFGHERRTNAEFMEFVRTISNAIYLYDKTFSGAA